MTEYTNSMAAKGRDICFEDANYGQKLMEVAKSFRTFDQALDAFIVQRGFTGDVSDADAKIRFIKARFRSAGIEFETRILRAWYQKHIQADKREFAFQFCFAFHLTPEETQDFFCRIYLQRPMDHHNIREAVYYYCLRNGLSYAEALDIYAKAPKKDGKGHLNLELEGEILYTGSILRELNRFQTPAELLTYLNDNQAQFDYNNATAKKFIQKLWEEIFKAGGLAERELKRYYRPVKGRQIPQRSIWDIFLQIFGMLEYGEDSYKPYTLEGDRTLKPLLRASGLVHPQVIRCFPDRQDLEEVIKGNWVSDESIRKTLILLTFYRFWVTLLLDGEDVSYFAQPEDRQRCMDNIDRILLDAGYQALYSGNPYDWIFLCAVGGENPLDEFRSFMDEVYAAVYEAPH